MCRLKLYAVILVRVGTALRLSKTFPEELR